MRPLTKAEIKALEEVIKYMIDAEKTHYEECTREEQKKHIYVDVLKLVPILTEEGIEVEI